MAISVLLIAAAASALRGGKYVHEDGHAVSLEAASIAVGSANTAAGADIVSDEFAAGEAGRD